MSDVQEHPTEDSTPDAPEASQDQPQVDWEKRYSDLQPEYTRASQEAAEYRRLVDSLRSDDSDTRRTAAEKLGLEFIEEDEPDDDFTDPTETFRRELDELKQSIAQRDEQAQAEAARARDVNYLDTQLGAIEKQAGVELTEEETKLLVGYALTNRDEQGRPDVQTAWQLFQAAENGLKKRWATSKKAPHISPVGKAGTDAPNLDNERERQQWMLQRLSDMGDAA